MKKILKRILAVVLILALVGAGIGGALFYTKKTGQKEIMVVSVESLYTQIYMDGSSSLDGNITTNVSQNVNVDQDSIIEDIYVQPGDHVKRGDKLISFDMTLQEMEQNINQLTLQSYKNSLVKAQNRLTSLQNGGPIEETKGSQSSSYGTYQDYSATGTSWEEDMNMDPIMGKASDTKTLGQTSMLLATARHIPLLTVFSQEGEELFQEDGGVTETNPFPEDPADGEIEIPWETPSPTQEPQEPGIIDVPEPTVTPEATATPVPTATPAVTGTPSEPGLFEDGMLTLYETLDENSEPYKGTGTEEDPYVFLCSTKEEKVVAMGSFLNLMAGYDKEGETLIQPGGYWYRLEFYDPETLLMYDGKTDPETVEEDLLSLCLGYYLVDGGRLEKPMSMQDELEYTLEHSTIPEIEDPMDNIDYGDWGSSDTTKTRQEAIKEQQKLIAGLQLDIRKKNLEISKLDKKLQKQTVVSSVDGVVKSVGDAVTGDYEGDAFMVIESDEGYYIKGTVSEMYLDEFQKGTIINGYSYENGVSFEAEVDEVSEYPVSSDSYSYYGYGTNSNASYYEFIAYVTDQSLELQNVSWVNLTFQSTQGAASNALNISSAFVRTENGQSYVYKDDQGVLKKQIVIAGASRDGGYSVPVTSGISMSDKLAFPYGSDVKEGAKTREGTLTELYEYGGVY